MPIVIEIRLVESEIKHNYQMDGNDIRIKSKCYTPSAENAL
jgi:hypothetical protein